MNGFTPGRSQEQVGKVAVEALAARASVAIKDIKKSSDCVHISLHFKEEHGRGPLHKSRPPPEARAGQRKREFFTEKTNPAEAGFVQKPTLPRRQRSAQAMGLLTSGDC
jgi:hypothetical protein